MFPKLEKEINEVIFSHKEELSDEDLLEFNSQNYNQDQEERCENVLKIISFLKTCQ